ncbi:MAG: hypothetical protein ACJ8EL_07790 [Rhizomicrobium sp.]
MYKAVRGALAADDAQGRQGAEPRFRVRDTPEWKKHAADLETVEHIRPEPDASNARAKLQELAQKYPAATIARQLGRGISALQKKAGSLKLSLRLKRPTRES